MRVEGILVSPLEVLMLLTAKTRTDVHGDRGVDWG